VVEKQLGRKIGKKGEIAGKIGRRKSSDGIPAGTPGERAGMGGRRETTKHLKGAASEGGTWR